MGNMAGFDANAPENQSSNSLVPAGTYRMVAVSSELKDTKKRDGKYFNFEFQILDGEFQNRRVFHKFNIKNSNEQAEQIGKGQLSQFCRAVNVPNPNDSSDLHMKQFEAKVIIKKAEENSEYSDQNAITAFKPCAPLGSQAKQFATPTQSPAPTTPVAASAGIPW